MRQILVLLMSFALFTANAQRLEMNQANVENAIKTKKKLPDKPLDFSVDKAGLSFVLNDGVKKADIDAFKNSFEVVVNGNVPKISFDEEDNGDNKFL